MNHLPWGVRVKKKLLENVAHHLMLMLLLLMSFEKSLIRLNYLSFSSLSAALGSTTTRLKVDREGESVKEDDAERDLEGGEDEDEDEDEGARSKIGLTASA